MRAAQSRSSPCCVRGVSTSLKNSLDIFPPHFSPASHPNKKEYTVANISSPVRGSKCNVFMNHINNRIRN